jgi:hypothetical protein
VQLPLQSLAGDAAIVRREIDRIGRPVVFEVDIGLLLPGSVPRGDDRQVPTEAIQ